MWAKTGSALDLAAAFIDFLGISSVSVPVLQFIGIILIAFLLGLFLGRITKRKIQKVVENSSEPEVDRVSLDFQRLTPLGPTAEEVAEHSAMDLSDLRSDQIPQKPAVSNQEEQQKPISLKE
ncbi:hypothetical protein [Candidatus Methylomirabilis sp.]|uniref:hypothetical protein n=1 Tax=Candidatus Methylomirabilis sp. TaxID=2032687 RepID=UPI002A64E17A|nr:hypothetical protein [Candidatus Methylomirabilis sp.]